MEKKALYRKYRPQNFDQVLGQQHIVKTLINEIKYNQTVHAYIFSGPKGSGKTSLAKIFSKAINCLDPQGYNPCNKCKNCLAINNNSSIDFVELDAASNSGVSEIRLLIDSLDYLPNDLKNKIYIIDEAHMLTPNSWNALLKSIEEPSNNIVFIFATTEYHKIPSTIVSRCERFDFNCISDLELEKLLFDVCKQEKISISHEAINIIVYLANGAARDALSILEQMRSYNNGKINESDLYEMFGFLSLDDIINFINTILVHDVQKLIMLINEFESRGINLYKFTIDMIEIMMDLYIYSSTQNLSLLKRIKNTKYIKLIKYKDIFLDIIELFNKNLLDIKNSERPRINFEYMILKASELQGFKSSLESNNYYKAQDQVQDLSKVKINSLLQNEKNIKQTKPINAPSLNIEIDNLFKTKEMNIGQKKEEVKINHNKKFNLDSKWNDISDVANNIEKIPEQKNEINLNLQDEFFAVAFNNNKNIKDFNNKILQDLKENSLDFSKTVNLFLKANKFLISSQNGAFILMDNKTIANEFNKISASDAFLEFYKSNFKCLQRVMAIDKDTAKIYLYHYKKINNPSFKDVKIISINDEKQRITDSMLKILNED